jgi:integrase
MCARKNCVVDSSDVDRIRTLANLINVTATLDRLGIPREKRLSVFHAFRHYAGSVVNDQTGNIKWAQTLLGHSHFSTTADVYIHTFD